MPSGCCAPGEGGTFLSASRGMCRPCRTLVDARYVIHGTSVYLERSCLKHGTARALVAESAAWYLNALRVPAAARPPEQVIERRAACPQACGPCEFHAQRCNLPVFSITNSCDLRCPICFTYNRSDQVYFMSPEEFARHIDFVIAATGGVDLINITGGEPTRHPQLLELLALAKRPEIGRITMNTNGLRLAEDEGLARGLAELGVYAVLSLDTFDPDRSRRLHGRDIVAQKKSALAMLERCGVQTTVLTVLVAGVNEDELPAMLALLVEQEFIRSLTIQTMTYTGQGGGEFTPRRHLPVDAVERLLADASGGRLLSSDFFPLPTAHPLCYGVSYLVTDGQGGMHPFTRLLEPAALAGLVADGYLLHPSDQLEQELRAAIDRLWSQGREPALLETLKRMLKAIFPPGQTLSVHERQRRAEDRVKTIYIHAHMDEDTWEVGRALRCPDQVPVHAERLIGACNYNLFYRQQDERFWVAP